MWRRYQGRGRFLRAPHEGDNSVEAAVFSIAPAVRRRGELLSTSSAWLFPLFLPLMVYRFLAEVS